MEFLLIGLTIIAAITEGFIDAVRSKKTIIEHYLSFWVRIILMGAAPFFALYQLEAFYLNVVFTGLLGSIYWIVFDIAFNIMAGNYWLYTGTTSKIDQFMRKIGGPGEILFTKIFTSTLFFMAYEFLKTL